MIIPEIRPTVIAIAASALVLVGTVSAGASAETMPTSDDIQAGRIAARSCTACHGAEGISATSEVPHLAGQHADYLIRALDAYRSNFRNGNDMKAVAVGLNDRDIAKLAAYFASLKPFSSVAKDPPGTNTPATIVEEDPFASTREATAPCAGCHGEAGNIDTPGMPSLAGQNPRYLVTALKAYRDGVRGDEIMLAFTELLNDTDMEDMAFFYAAAQPKQAETPISGDRYAGRAVARACAGCHGEDGNSKDPAMPRLAGLDATYLETALMAYKDGTRPHAAMRDALASIRQTEFADVAAFFAQMRPTAPRVRKILSTAQWVENCNKCHGPGGNSIDPRYPILAGQSQTYLINSLKLYHMGERTNSMMFAMSFPLREKDIRKLAAYYAARTAR